VCIIYGMVITGEYVECLRNCIDSVKCGVFTKWYCQGKVWRDYRIVLRGESAECLWNGFDRGKCVVFTECY